MAEQVQTNDNSLSANPVPCLNNCGFFGNPKTQNYCSKCFKCISQSQTPSDSKSTPSPMDSTPTPSPAPSPSISPSSSLAPLPVSSSPLALEPAAIPAPTISSPSPSPSPVANSESGSAEKAEQKKKNRCFSCNKKVGISGFSCRCEFVFCGEHRLPQLHNCQFDNKKLAQDNIRKANPKVESSKLEKI